MANKEIQTQLAYKPQLEISIENATIVISIKV